MKTQNEPRIPFTKPQVGLSWASFLINAVFSLYALRLLSTTSLEPLPMFYYIWGGGLGLYLLLTGLSFFPKVWNIASSDYGDLYEKIHTRTLICALIFLESILYIYIAGHMLRKTSSKLWFFLLILGILIVCLVGYFKKMTRFSQKAAE